MGPTQKLLWKLYVGVIGAVTTVVAQRLVKAGWKLVTGNEPPSPTDPDTPVLEAMSWALASGIGAAAVVGLGREIHDKRTPGKWFSYRDLAWDAAGIGSAALLLSKTAK